jgi:hypothetical protein
MPIALASCSPYVVWDVASPSGRFDFVYLDGRVANFDFNEPLDELTMLWEVRPRPPGPFIRSFAHTRASRTAWTWMDGRVGGLGAGDYGHDCEPQSAA